MNCLPWNTPTACASFWRTGTRTMSEDIAAPNETTIAALSGMDQGTRDRALVMLQSYGHDIEAIKEKLTQPATPAPTPQPSLDPERAQAMRENAQRLGISSDAIDRMLDPTEMSAFSNVHLDPLTFHDLPSQDVAALEHELKVTLAQAEVEPGLASGFMRAFGEAYKNFGNIASMSDFERQQHFQAEGAAMDAAKAIGKDATAFIARLPEDARQ